MVPLVALRGGGPFKGQGLPGGGGSGVRIRADLQGYSQALFLPEFSLLPEPGPDVTS